MAEIVWYAHHGRIVAVDAAHKHHHREACLCYRCTKFDDEDNDSNCHTANLIYAVCVLTGVVTPIWECPDFSENPD